LVSDATYGGTAGRVELAILSQFLDDGDDIGLPALVEKAEDGLVRPDDFALE
jgi:hypothetical protein